jgi:predicted O-methyltransferase YrrM
MPANTRPLGTTSAEHEPTAEPKTASSNSKAYIQAALPPHAELPKKLNALDTVQRLELLYDLTSPFWAVPEELIPCIESSSSNCLMPIAQRLFLWSFIYGVCPKRYLEIGTAAGGSAMIVLSAVKALGFDDFQGVCVDPKFELAPEVLAYLEPHFSFFEAVNSLQVLKKAVSQVSGLFDVVLVDGDHTYDYTLNDIMSVIPFVRSGGYILVDDAGYFQVRDAIQYTVEHFHLVDCGFICRHITPFEEFHEIPQDGPWQGEMPFMSGLHLLRKPLV